MDKETNPFKNPQIVVNFDEGQDYDPALKSLDHRTLVVSGVCVKDCDVGRVYC